MFEFFVDMPITNNIKKLIKTWNRLSNRVVKVYDIEKAKNDPSLAPYYNDLGFSFVNIHTDEFEIYSSNIYTEAHVIHETLHQILREEGYCVARVYRKDIYFYPDYIGAIACEFKDALINHMDHLVINIRIKEYDLDLKKMYNNEYTKMKENLIILKNKNLHGMEKLMYRLIFTIRSLDCYFYPEPYKKKIFDLLEEIDKKAHEYSKEFYNIVVQNGYLSKENFKESLLLILNKMDEIVKNEINRSDPCYNVFKLIKIV